MRATWCIIICKHLRFLLNMHNTFRPKTSQHSRFIQTQPKPGVSANVSHQPFYGSTSLSISRGTLCWPPPDWINGDCANGFIDSYVASIRRVSFSANVGITECLLLVVIFQEIEWNRKFCFADIRYGNNNNYNKSYDFQDIEPCNNNWYYKDCGLFNSFQSFLVLWKVFWKKTCWCFRE